MEVVVWACCAPRRRGTGGAKTGLAAEVELHLEDFYREYDFWAGFCRATGARIHVTMYKQFPEHEARHAAFHDAGGLSVAIQRSVEREPHLLRRTTVDVNFAHCRDKARVEKESRSRISQVVVTGYPFDSAFPDARRQGAELKARLRERGARFILCYLDQNEGGHRKMLGGRERTREHSRFLCRKAAADPQLGLIFKPKRSDTLPARLGPVWESVQELVKAGRCIVLETTGVDSRYLPCAAAAGADVAVNLAYGATAGLESRLADTPVLLLATPGVDPGLFSSLPPGSVLFESWEELWNAVEQLRADPAHPAIGNWDPVMDNLAEFRDGKAAERIGRHISRLQEALQSGKGPEEALEEAAAQYKRAWGAGSVFGLDPEEAQTFSAETTEAAWDYLTRR